MLTDQAAVRIAAPGREQCSQPRQSCGSKGRRAVIPQRKHCVLSLENCRMDAGHSRTAGVQHSETASHKSSTQTFNSSQARFHIHGPLRAPRFPFSPSLCASGCLVGNIAGSEKKVLVFGWTKFRSLGMQGQVGV